MRIGIGINIVGQFLYGIGQVITNFDLYNNNSATILYHVDDALTTPYQIKD